MDGLGTGATAPCYFEYSDTFAVPIYRVATILGLSGKIREFCFQSGKVRGNKRFFKK